VSAREHFQRLVALQKAGVPVGTASVCSAERSVLEAAFLQASRDGLPVLIESTANQVNQQGGYTGMTPQDFRQYAQSVAEHMRFPQERLILGGDHLGPYPWRGEGAEAAMSRACELVAACARAGYEKIHLDASMPLRGDPLGAQGELDPRLVAQREARLAAAAEAARAEQGGAHAGAARAGVLGPGAADDDGAPPVYVIGTEVPAPGGMVSEGAGPTVTTPEELLETLQLCEGAFARLGLEDAWSRVCAIVVQPGVEYGDHAVHPYDRAKAAALCAAARAMPGVVLEGHSTDYQLPLHLRHLVEDGVAVLKVGPALTFAVRESLFALEEIEGEMLRSHSSVRPSRLSAALERAMVDDPSHWKGYYTGSEEEQRRARRYSFSDRSRYYWTVPSVAAAVQALFSNLERTGMPLTLLSQFLPRQYEAVREGSIPAKPQALVREAARHVLSQYSAAIVGRQPGRG
jgi:D-tagatose-1,6-bisphosphate aldolase subunit GatZ/KbaZ